MLARLQRIAQNRTARGSHAHRIAQDMEVFEVLEMIRKRPNLYLDGEKSLQILYTFLNGYERGIVSRGETLSLLGALRPFNDWVAKQLGFTGSARGWHNMMAKTDSDEKAF